jgi:hypothetical protein
VLVHQGVQSEALKAALALERERKDLYELSDPTYPKTPLEEDYVAGTNRYLSDINARGIDVILGERLLHYATTQHSMQGAHIVRLATAKTIGHDLMVAQALAFADLVGEPKEFTGTYVGSDELDARLTRGGNTDTEAHLFVDENLASDPSNWVNVLLKRYLATGDERWLDALALLSAYWQLEDLIVDPLFWLRQWMLTSQIWQEHQTPATPIEPTTLVDWATMRSHLAEVGDAQRTLWIAALLAIDARYGLPDAQVAASYLFLG